MKSKEFNKRFTLNKQTVCHLNDEEMNTSKGGFTVDGIICTTREVCSDLLSCHPYC
jgi:hypothetical protein